jgi:hypothetical protein
VKIKFIVMKNFEEFQQYIGNEKKEKDDEKIGYLKK